MVTTKKLQKNCTYYFEKEAFRISHFQKYSFKIVIFIKRQLQSVIL